MSKAMKKFTWFLLLIAVLAPFSPNKAFSNKNFSTGELRSCLVTVNVTLSTGLEPTGTIVTCNGIIDTISSSNSTIVFDIGTQGLAVITAFKLGYDFYILDNNYINCNDVVNIFLSEKKYPPTCLEVDSLTLKATWCEPLRTALEEDFENPEFPPAGWQALPEQEGWYRTNDGNNGNWTIPAWDSYYAVTYPYGDGCCDYLITPAVDLRESEGYTLSFNSYYDGAFGELAFVEYSLDGCITWEVLCQLNPAVEWTDMELNLSAFSGPDGPEQIWFAFHADDAGAWASGWAVDNIKIQVPEPPANYIDFWVFLNDTLVGVTTETNWDYAPLLYGMTYTASVAARYSSGLSSKDYFTFTSKYLFPPDSLTGTMPDDAAILQWYPPIESWPAMSLSGTRGKMLSDGSRDVGDVIMEWPAPSPISLCWGICDDGSELWITDPNLSATNIYEVTYDGVNTGVYMTISLGQSWIGDMVSDGEFLYGCLVGGPNTIVKVEIATGDVVETISGAWTVDAQYGLAADFFNEEFYIGGWTSNQVWRTDFSGATISIFAFTDVSGLAWHPAGGPNGEGSLWVIKNAVSDVCTEVDPNNSWATIQSFVIPNDQGYSGTGAEIKRSMPYGGDLWLPNASDNTIYLVDLMEPYSCCPPEPLPENLLGYNIYRDGAFVAYKPHEPPGEYVPQGYVDEDLWPGAYAYTVTALYDLAPYGYPGDTAESMPEGPAEVIGWSCYDLEFVESWSMGTFDDSNWLAEGANWSVNNQFGNPSPAAEFSGDPVITGYDVSLISYPICAVGMTEGKIWLDFDLKLDAVGASGDEMIEAEVWNWETSVWNTVAVYSNSDGSFDWTSEHINIKSQAMDKVFRIRFRATGNNSADIVGWFIDNIDIYRACEGPTNLQAFVIEGDGIGLSWDMFGGDSTDEWIHWDDGVSLPLSRSVRELAGFNVYRKIGDSDWVLLDFITEFTYTESSEGLIPGTMYCFMVSAVYTSESDQCESDFSNEACVLWTSIDDQDAGTSSFNLYPNPADDHVYISASDDLQRITIYDATGKLIKDEITQGKQLELPTSTYTIGVYLVRVETGAGVMTRTLTIQR
jgi:hypothetical protein